MVHNSLVKSVHKRLIRNADLAELIGIILGDGNLYKYPRTESLRVICDSKDVGYIRHIARLIKKVFDKRPSIIKRKNENTTVVCLYEGKISERLHIPLGNKIKNKVRIPIWATLNKRYIIRCLKGLFETDGCFQEDKSNYAQYIEFKNDCKKLREDVYSLLLKLGLNPQLGHNYVRLAKRSEVYKFKELIEFRNYNNCPVVQW